MPELGQLPLSEGASTLVGRNRHQRVQVPSWHPSNPRPLQGSKLSVCVSQTVAPPSPSQDGASQNMETMVQGLVKSFMTQLGVIPEGNP